MVALRDECLEEKKDGEKMVQQKVNALRKKLEAEYHEKEKSLKTEMEKKAKEQEESVLVLEKSLREQCSAKYQQYIFCLIKRQLKQEVEKMKQNYKAKEKELETQYQNKQKELELLFIERDARTNNRVHTEDIYTANHKALLNSSVSDVDSEMIARESELRVQYEADRKLLVEDYEAAISKLSNELTITTSQQSTKLQDALQIFTKIFCLELDKLQGIANGRQVLGVNSKIAKMIIAVTPDGKCREYLEAFKRKLNSVILALKSSLESAKVNEQAIDKHGILNEKSPFELVNGGDESKRVKRELAGKSTSGKCAIDIEKAVNDLALIKDSFRAAFQGIDTVADELNREEGENAEDAASRYRILLNTILRFTVEAAWILKNRLPDSLKQKEPENEELVRMKLLNSELSDMLVSARQEIASQQKRLALFVGEHE